MAFSKNCVEVLGEPDIVNDVKPFLKQKLASIGAHRTQFQLEQIFGGKTPGDKEVQERFGTERFWTYRFD